VKETSVGTLEPQNTRSRLFVQLSSSAALAAFVSPAQRGRTAANSYEFASVPPVAGDDPVNESDPSGLFTVGICGGASAEIEVWRGWGGSGAACAFVQYGGFLHGAASVSIAETLGYSFRGLGVGANGFAGIQISTAASPHDLTGWFQQWTVTAAAGPYAGEIDVWWGTDSAGNRVFGANLGWAPGADVSVSHWKTYTWVQTWNLPWGSSAVAAPLWAASKALVDIPSQGEQAYYIGLARETFAKSGCQS